MYTRIESEVRLGAIRRLYSVTLKVTLIRAIGEQD